MSKLIAKVEIQFDDVLINIIKESQPRKSGIYRKVYNELKQDIINAYYKTRKKMKEDAESGKEIE